MQIFIRLANENRLPLELSFANKYLFPLAFRRSFDA
jgi:hypothetical protein